MPKQIGIYQKIAQDQVEEDNMFRDNSVIQKELLEKVPIAPILNAKVLVFIRI